MHIKNIELSGFKSYKEAGTAEPLSRGINVVLGANGSGKSNFFHAIRFVLNDAFTNMRAEERLQLLHEGAGHAVPQAYVEVVFDNSDGRFPVDKDEVRLRRTIGKNKDEYHLDRKHINKSEVSNLLESAGFSRANPYYIVQQGKIMSMSAMRDDERLELLKEIGGTKVYEERRQESLTLMADTESKRAQIEDVMNVIEDKLKELDAERQELVQFQTADRERRAIEFALLDAQLAKAKQQLDQVEEDAQKLREEQARSGGGAGGAGGALAELQERARGVEDSSAAAKRHAVNTKARLDEMVGLRLTLEADVADLKVKVKRAKAVADGAGAEAKDAAAKVAAAEENLRQARSSLASAQAEVVTAQTRVEVKETRRRALLTKQGGGKQYGSAKERNAVLQKQIDTLEGVAAQEAARLSQASQQLSALNEQLLTLDQAITDKQAAADAAEVRCTAAEAELRKLEAQRNQAVEGRKECWRAEAEAGRRAEDLAKELRQRQQAFENTMARDISRGVTNLINLVRDHGVQGVHGRLIDLMDCGPELYRAVEVTGGNSMFNIVVDTDKVALQCTKLLQQHKAGRVTFMPLNTLSPPSAPQVPQEYGTDVIPLVRKIRFEDKFRPAVQQVFGRTMLCKDMDTATLAARQSDFNCVTMDGDQVSKAGALTGGYHDERQSRMLCRQAVTAVTQQLSEARAEAEAASAQARQLDTEVNRLNSLYNQGRARRDQLRQVMHEARAEASQSARDRQLAQNHVANLEQSAAGILAKQPGLAAQIVDLKGQQGTSLTTTLTPEEQQELTSLPVTLKATKQQLKQAEAALEATQAKVDKVASLLTDVLQPRLAELDTLGRTEQLEAVSADLEAVRARLGALVPTATAAAAAHKEASLASDEAAAESVAARSAVGEARDVATHREARDAEVSRQLEEVAGRRAQIGARAEDLSKRMRDLGTLPADAFDRNRGKSTKELQRALAAVAQQLGQLSGVNRQALDQYTSFIDQRQDLVGRKSEMDLSETKIRELIATLDARKNEAIERTFKGVAKHFREVFAELVPGGRGELVMQKRHPGGIPAPDEEGEDEELGGARGKTAAATGTLERYSGVKVRVAFTLGGETMSLKQLSGGQKTLVALALIFAIQRCDPAPFYLFDEIDAALDPQYRTTVARLLRKQASDKLSPAQFIITTFHPQVVGEADQLYGVAHQNRMSRVFTISQADAYKFLQTTEEQQGQAPAAAAPVAAAPAPRSKARGASRADQRARPGAQDVEDDLMDVDT